MAVDLITSKVAAELAAMGNDELRAELTRTLSLTADSISRMAAIIRELESRGEDLSDLRIGMVPFLRRIAHGQLSASAVVRFASRPLLLQQIGNLPLPDQEKLAGGEPVRLMVGGGDFRLVDPMDLTRDQFFQVFARDHIRDDSEQSLVLQQKSTQPKKKRKIQSGRVRPDRERMGLIVGRAFAPIDDVLAGLRGLRDVDETEEDGEEKTVAIKLTASEHRRLRMAAAKVDTSMADLVHRALEAAGLI